MNANQKTSSLLSKFERRGINISFDDANSLRRAELTLQRWSELECGNGNDYSSWSIERDEETDIPYMCIYPHKGEMRKYKIADREKGAIKRIAAICQKYGLNYFHQTDPRGCALYVDISPIPSNNYTSAIACCE